MKETKGCRLLLIPLPLQGHINPMLQLAQILYSNGFSITIIHTSFNSLNPSNYPHFNFCCIKDGLSESSASNLLNLVVELNIRCVKPFKECLGKLLCDVSEEPIACLISDAMCYFTQDVATSFKLPRLVLRTGGASSFVAFAAFPYLRENGYFPIQESKLEDGVKELPPLRVKDLPMINTKEPEKYYELICNFVNKTKASLGVIWNTFEDLESLPLSTLSQQFSIPMFPIGPFHKYFPTNNTSSSSSLIPQDQNCISWLNKHKPKSVVYVSFGSVASITEAEFLEIAWGLVNSNYPFLWVVRPGLIGGHEWLGPLPNGFMENLEGRGYIVKWAPQQEILAHQAVGLFWTHNGWNSTLESICEGVPMICMPCFTDQKVNARYVSHVWRIGLQLENGMERGKIERTIRKMMEDDIEGNEIRDRALKLKEEARVCLKKGGFSCSSLGRLVVHILSLVSFTFEAS
ncbi:putative cytokinin 7-beta-glucosyltransferase [Medicago truncatula]|uniref:Putative cytokinin 7-beta-glucosyltransferase n=1 Tax=Medicago truncatula TaxID=3880 RepID=G7JAK1_MEDTR|nr:UDP-glycosyltransferase 76B1 [Medicago truncatula]XP_039687352.1 UDP-glycosyltransferase 76B1 [Medicago truncatula]AES71065.1 UDP-glucosyltransferase family protein [Medicago truncatula]RHN68333.1 putative cytokinin 7-beta-glucosyltransferase [Medicago truncatula]